MRKGLTLIACTAAIVGLSNVGWAAPPSAGSARNGSPQKAPDATLPYYNDFNEGESSLEGWTFVNTNPAFTWKWSQYSGYEYTPCLYFSQMPVEGTDTPSDNWVFTPAFKLEAGFTYQLKFYITNWFPADLEVRLTTGTDISNPGTLLYHYEDQDWGDKVITFEVPSTGDYHIAFYDKSPYTENGTALRYQTYIDNFSLMALSNNAVPEAVGSLTQVPGANGEISMSLEWFNPTLSKKGEELDVLTEVQITKDGKLAETLRSGIAPGAKMSWTDPDPTKGVHTYKVVVFNSTGEGDPAEVNTFIGIDDPGAPQNLVMDYDSDAGIITLDWEEPQFGRRGGWFDKIGLSYRVVRQPGNKILANNLNDPYFEDEDLNEYGNYIYEVTTRTDAGIGGTATTTGVLVGSTASLPIIEGWENADKYPTWEIVDNNNDGHTIYVRHAFGHDSNSALGWDYLTTEVPVDESLYSAPVRLEKGKKYRASFWIMSHMFGSFSCDFTYGKAKTRAAQNNTLISYSEMSTGGDYAPSDVKEFTVDETGTYYFSLWVHDCSHHRLWFDDFRIEEVFDKNIEASAVRNLNDAPTVGDKITTGVSYSNRGTGRSSSFKVQLIDNDDNVLGEQSVSRALSAGADGTANIEWTVPNAVGKFAVRGRVVMDGDMCEADNTTDPYYIDVQETGKRAVTIGNESGLESVPFGYYSYNVTEMIYPGEDFGNLAGNIYSMAFKVQFGMEGDFPGVPFRVYLANTTEDDLFKGWIPANYQMTKVFDGTLDLMRGMTEVVIPFDTPFSYGGGNICVLVEGQHDQTLMLSNGYGMSAYVTEAGLGATRSWDGYERPDMTNPDQTQGKYYTCRPNATFYVDHSVAATITGTITDTDGNPVEGAVINGGYSYPNLKAVTDADGKYEIPYFPVGYGYASLEVNKTGYQTGRPSGQLKTGETAVIDFNQMKKCTLVTVKGKVCSAVDNATPVAGAKITAIGDNELSAVTNAQGEFELEGAYAGKGYPVYTIEADGYKPVNWGGTQFYDPGTGIAEQNVNLTPITAAPFSVAVSDRGDKAEITWEEPVEDVTVTKATDDIVGMFGGNGMISVAHRYSPDELKTLGVSEDLLLKAVRFFPMCYAKFTLAIWQGPEGNEAPVYLQDVNTTKFKEWNEFVLSEPYKIDPSQSLLIGFKINSSAGSYPVSFDNGPLVEGGDVILDAIQNQWTTAHEVLPGQMDYNWAIQGVFGNNPNSLPVPWFNKPDQAAAKAISRQNATLEELAILNGTAIDKKDEKVEVADLSKAGIEMLETPLHAPSAKSGLTHEIKGYNIYRIEPGQETSYMGMWPKVNEEPVTGTSFTDESWSGIEDKPYRYAVVSYYGNPYEWGMGVTSDPTFSDGIDKGRYSSVTVNVSADKGSAEGANVYLVGDGKSLFKTVEKGKNSVTFDDVRFENYEIKAFKPYFNLYTAQVTVDTKESSHDAALTFSAPVVPDMEAVDYINEARLAWTEPTAAVGMDVHSAVANPGQELPGFNNGQETIVGYRLTPAARAGYDYTDFYFYEISFYANAATTYYPVVWRRNLEPQRPYWEQVDMEEEHEIYRQRYDVSPEEVGTWITVKLDEPVKINSKDTYYVGFAATNTNEVTPLIIDDTGKDYEGQWYYSYDQKNFRYDWIHPTMGGSWMVKAHITDNPNKETIEKEAVKYDLYRLASADMENEKNWKKVNSTPLDTDSYVDASWKDQPTADYRYAVKAIYERDAASAATFSKELPKGRVALINLDLSVNNGLTPAGAKVALSQGRDIYRAEAKADGKIEIPEVKRYRNYDLTINLPGYEEIAEKIAVNEDMVSMKYELAEVKEAPIYLEAVASADNSKVDLTWREPGQYAPAEGWVHWDNGQPYGGFGTSTGFCAVAQAFMPEDLEAMRMKEYDITKISFFPTDSKSNPTSANAYWVGKIWRVDMNSGEAEEVATGNASDVKLNNWNEIVFDTPYHVNGDETLLIGYEFHGSGNALGIDEGPCKMGRGDWANFGDGWMTLSSVTAFDYNNLIHIYMENLSSSDRAKAPAIGPRQPILKDAKADVKISKVSARNAQKADHPQLAFGVNYPYKGFRVYRLNATDRDNESAWTELTSEPIKDTRFSDINWKNVGKGNYLWAVKAVYATGDSAPEFSLDVLDETGKVSSVEDLVAEGIRIDRISRDKLLVDVPAGAQINMVDAAGITILAANIAAGENIIDINVPDGIYLIRIAMNGNVRTLKLMIK
ncbi:MAG: carboxypeptidase regulatory-like domain-containing protein [Muribaculaceae bacterium]|nr:carboxypeptidase regulatory-like domain-containing protein [Muribaculaceae bacterium]